jgi:fructosamine-3-kinase
VDFQGLGPGDFGKPGNFFARQIGRWSRQWELSRTRADANMERLIASLPNHVPDNDVTSFVHGDYRIGNLMFHPTEPRVVALLEDASFFANSRNLDARRLKAWQGVPERSPKKSFLSFVSRS